MGLATINPHSQKEHTEIHKIPTLMLIGLVLTEIQAFKNLKKLQDLTESNFFFRRSIFNNKVIRSSEKKWRLGRSLSASFLLHNVVTTSFCTPHKREEAERPSPLVSI